MAANVPVAAPAPQPPAQQQLKLGYHHTGPLPEAFAIPKGTTDRYTLIDRTWTLGAQPLAIAKQSYPFSCNGVNFSITHDVLLSTSSNMQRALTHPDYADDPHRYVLASLSQLGQGDEAVVHTILDYMHSGRFDSAVSNRSQYTIEFSTAIIGQALTTGMTKVRELALIEMKREFFGRQMGPGMQIKLVDMTQAQIINMARVGFDELAWGGVWDWAIQIYHYPTGQRMASKHVIETILKKKGKELTPLNKGFKKLLGQMVQIHGENGDFWRQGECGRLRELVERFAPEEVVQQAVVEEGEGEGEDEDFGSGEEGEDEE